MSNALPRHRHQAFIRQACRCYYSSCLMWEDDIETFRKQHGLSKAEAKRVRCTAEHLTAQQDGGTDAAVNIAAACLHCNQTRHKARTPLDPIKYWQRVRKCVRRGEWHQPRVRKLCDLTLPEAPSL